jgi:hypothetical protein
MRRILDEARRLSSAFGLAMAAAAGIGTGGAAFVWAIAALLAVLAGIRFRFASTLAVLLAGAAVMSTDAPPLVAGVAGLSAACYLVLRHTERGTGPRTASSPSLLAALGLTCVAVAAASLPLELPWLPLAAPLPVFAIFMLAIWPYRRPHVKLLRIATPSAPRPWPTA